MIFSHFLLYEDETVTVHCATGDGASNSQKSLSDYVGEKNFIWCVAHRLHLVVGHSLLPVQDLISKVRSTVNSIKQSSILRSKLSRSSSLELISDLPTRWSSAYQMVKRFLRLLPFIKSHINNDSDFADSVCQILIFFFHYFSL